MSNSPSCPHCGQRVIKNSDKCLHCGKYVYTEKAKKTQGSSSGGPNLTTILVFAIVIIGGGFIISMGMCGKTAIDVQQNGVNFDNATATVCVSETDNASIADFQSKGWTEIEAEPGQRCFQE